MMCLDQFQNKIVDVLAVIDAFRPDTNTSKDDQVVALEELGKVNNIYMISLQVHK